MNQLEERIAQYQKMANDDPDNELAHHSLGKLLLEAGRPAEAVQSFRRSLELNPLFSKPYQLLADCLLQMGQRAEAVKVLREGFKVADERGDYQPRDAMAKKLVGLGESAPVSAKASGPAGGDGGFRCQRPGCMWGSRARQLARPPFNDDLGQRIQQAVCADCWNEWLRNFSIKVINELRLDLSTEQGQAEYDRYMREFLGID
jgi:tetratricopeptide (TPR) repeat protein